MKKKRARKPAGPSIRLPLPKKTERIIPDKKKYYRKREKERLRREIP